VHQAIQRINEDRERCPNYEIVIKEIKYVNLWRRRIKTDLSEESGIDPLERVLVYRKSNSNWINTMCVKDRIATESMFWRNVVRWESIFLPSQEQTYKLIFIKGREKIPCLLTGALCSQSILRSINKVFVGYASSPNFFSVNAFKRNLRGILLNLGLQPSFWDEKTERGHFDCKICKEIQESVFVIWELSDINPNVLFEFGFSIAIGKDYFALHKRGSRELPSDVAGLDILKYASFRKLASTLTEKIQSRYSEILQLH
jgi:hypothetical protein